MRKHEKVLPAGKPRHQSVTLRLAAENIKFLDEQKAFWSGSRSQAARMILAEAAAKVCGV